MKTTHPWTFERTPDQYPTVRSQERDAMARIGGMRLTTHRHTGDVSTLTITRPPVAEDFGAALEGSTA